LISRKLGGPVVVSPVRPKVVKSASAGAIRSRPGAITKRPVAPKPRRSLQRVLTDERHSRAGSRGPSGAISLMRSATAPVMPGLKREESDTPTLASVPSVESQSMSVSRGGVLKSKKFSQREVDLSCLGPGYDGKMKKAAIEAELKEAISALKRPNRQLAGQSIVETAEKRAASASTHSKSESSSSKLQVQFLTFTESKKPVRNPSFQGVQIFSTPKGNRHKEGLSDSQPLPKMSFGHRAELEVVPPSSIPRIPLSALRSTNSRDYERTPVCKATPLREKVAVNGVSSTQITPSEVQTKSSSNLFVGFVRKNILDEGGHAPCSPLESRHGSRQQALDVPVPFGPAVACTPTKVIAVQATPIKQTMDTFLEKTEFSNAIARTSRDDMMRKNQDLETPEETGEDSIYKLLGWDDNDELE
jgi:DNA replication regulator SLD3